MTSTIRELLSWDSDAVKYKVMVSLHKVLIRSITTHHDYVNKLFVPHKEIFILVLSALLHQVWLHILLAAYIPVAVIGQDYRHKVIVHDINCQ